MTGKCDMRCCSGGKLITILSIDGGGVRGIIPGKILAFLESELKKLDGENVSISEYFDIIAGTSTGGLIAAMLATADPDESQGKKPIIAAKDICNFYFQHSPNIFPKQESSFWNSLQQAVEPRYKGDYLHTLIKEKLGERKLGETLTNVLLTSFDIKLMQPVIFSTLRAKANDVDNSLMSDVCISTSAAPTFFAPHYFVNKTLSATKEFNVADGGLAANNPTMLAIGEMAKESRRERGCNDCSKQTMYLVLSLGTGSVKNDGKLVVNGFTWGLLDWFMNFKDKSSVACCPLIDSFSNAASDMVDLYTTMYLEDRIRMDNYLRIQYDDLSNSEAAMDNASEDNLKKLAEMGDELLKKPVASVDLATGKSRPISIKVTNEEAITKFAKRLSDERRRRLEKM